jgi:hypothetical protein
LVLIDLVSPSIEAIFGALPDAHWFPHWQGGGQEAQQIGEESKGTARPTFHQASPTPPTSKI